MAKIKLIVNPLTGKLTPVELLSQPPGGHYKIVNMYVNATTGKLEVEYEVP